VVRVPAVALVPVPAVAAAPVAAVVVAAANKSRVAIWRKGQASCLALFFLPDAHPCLNRIVRILVIEDERRMGDLLTQALSEEGHQVLLLHDGQQGLDAALCAPFDVIVLDVLLPRLDGLALARRLRENRRQTPILMLTARDAPQDIVRGLDAGADDYLTKPFTLDLLLARIRAVSRRGVIPRLPFLEVDDLRLDPATRQVMRAGKNVSLTPREYHLLELLMRNAGRAVSRDTILESVWGVSSDVAENTLEVFMRQLRLKIDTSQPKLLHTIRGFGYMLRGS